MPFRFGAAYRVQNAPVYLVRPYTAGLLLDQYQAATVGLHGWAMNIGFRCVNFSCWGDFDAFRCNSDRLMIHSKLDLFPVYSSYCPSELNIIELFSNFSFRYSYTVNVTACPGATRMTRGVIPL